MKGSAFCPCFEDPDSRTWKESQWRRDGTGSWRRRRGEDDRDGTHAAEILQLFDENISVWNVVIWYSNFKCWLLFPLLCVCWPAGRSELTQNTRDARGDLIFSFSSSCLQTLKVFELGFIYNFISRLCRLKCLMYNYNLVVSLWRFRFLWTLYLQHEGNLTIQGGFWGTKLHQTAHKKLNLRRRNRCFIIEQFIQTELLNNCIIL